MIGRRLFGVLTLSAVVVVLGTASSSTAQEREPDFWGTGTNFHFVSAEELQCADEATTYLYYWGSGFWLIVGDSYCLAPVRLPTGSLVTGMTILYFDSDPSENIVVEFNRNWVDAAGNAGSAQIGPTFESTGTPGVAAGWVDIDPDYTILYVDGTTAQSFVLKVSTANTPSVRFRGVIIGWNRQISPAPAEATFADVPVGAFGFKHVEALAASGITSGCGGGNFCPNQPLTRVQMAVFLAKALGLHWAP